MTSVVIVDDHPPIAAALSVASEEAGIHVIGQGTTPEEAAPLYRRLAPDVLVLDIRFGRGASTNGLDAAREVLAGDPTAKIVFYSQFDSDEQIRDAYRLGAASFIPKSTPLASVADAIARASRERVYFLPEVAARIPPDEISAKPSALDALDPRELEVFVFMAQGLTNLDMVDRLGLSPRTISTLSQTVKTKLNMHRKIDLAMLAIKHGLISP